MGKYADVIYCGCISSAFPIIISTVWKRSIYFSSLSRENLEKLHILFLSRLKQNNCMNDPVRHKKLIKNLIKSSKLIYDNTFTNKKSNTN